MKPAVITGLVQGIVAVVEEVPNIVQVIENAFSAQKLGSGPTNEQIAAALKQGEKTNETIQRA